MKAIIISKPGPPDVLRMEDRPIPVPNDDEVLIQVEAAGINRPDCIQRAGYYPAPPGAPQDIPGLEVAGVISDVGHWVKRWKKGDRVCALLAGGGYAQYAVAHSSLCLPVPYEMDFVQAASLPETVFTVWHNVFSLGKLKSGENFLVHGGSSGIGVMAIQLAKAFGANVFTTAGSKEKCEACMNLGADKCIVYAEKDFGTELEPIGMDLVLDMVGGDYIEKNLKLLRPDGRLVFINSIKGSKGQFDALDLMRRRLTITGSTLRSREIEFKAALASAVEKEVWPLFALRKIHPVLFKVFPFWEAASAHKLMEDHTHIGKIMLDFGSV